MDTEERYGFDMDEMYDIPAADLPDEEIIKYLQSYYDELRAMNKISLKDFQSEMQRINEEYEEFLQEARKRHPDLSLEEFINSLGD